MKKSVDFPGDLDYYITCNEIDALASWNFKHIVSINPIRKIHEINKKLNFPMIEIGSLELFGGAKYGNL